MSERAVAIATSDNLTLTFHSNKLAASAPSIASDPPTSFLQLPAELRFLIYSFLSPISSTNRNDFGKTHHLNLIQACRQIRQEAPPEIEKATQQFYRDYEKSRYKDHGERICVRKCHSWCHIVVELDNDFTCVDTVCGDNVRQISTAETSGIRLHVFRGLVILIGRTIRRISVEDVRG
jgi:hypothetical protein